MDQTWKTQSQSQEGRPEKELERQTCVCGNSLLRGPVPALTQTWGGHNLCTRAAAAVAQSGPEMRENCSPGADNICKEWIFGKSPSASWVPTSPHLLRPPPTGSSPFSCSDSYKNSTAFHQQPGGASLSTAAAQDSESDPETPWGVYSFSPSWLPLLWQLSVMVRTFSCHFFVFFFSASDFSWHGFFLSLLLFFPLSLL